MDIPSWVSVRLLTQAALAVAFAATLSGGVFLLARSANSGGSVELVLPTATSAASVDVQAYITGEVRNPGVYNLGPMSRLVDLIDAAGGTTADADLTGVNLAARVRDEDHWHIPRIGEAAPENPGESSGQTLRVDINTASIDELMTLPGIGQVRAQAIFDYREATGPFTRIEDLLLVSGIGPATLDALRDLIEVR